MSDKIKVLVIFDIIPEETKMAINWVDQAIYDRIVHAHGICMNGDQEFTEEEIDGFEIINSGFSTDPASIADGYEEFVGLFGEQHEVEGNDIADVQKLIHTSFYL